MVNRRWEAAKAKLDADWAKAGSGGPKGAALAAHNILKRTQLAHVFGSLLAQVCAHLAGFLLP